MTLRDWTDPRITGHLPKDQHAQVKSAFRAARTPRIATAVLTFSALAVAALPTLAVGQDSSLSETQRLAEQGDALAQYNLGVMYDNGEGVPEDDAEAVRWYRMAAEQGFAPAQYNLGNMYVNGEGVPENYVLAYAWFNLAAAQGHETAVSAKADVEGLMTAAQITEAQELSTTLFARINGGG